MHIFKKIITVVLIMSFLAVFASCGEADKDIEQTTKKSDISASQDDTTISNEANSNTTIVSESTTDSKNADTKNQTLRTAPETVTNRQGYSTIAPLIARTTNKKGDASESFVKSLKGFELNILQAWELPKSGIIADDDAWSISQVEKEYGVKINNDGFFAGYNEKLAVDLGANNVKAQICMVQDFNFASYFKNGYIADLSGGMAKSGVDFKEPWYNQDARMVLNISNKQYGFIAYGAEYTFPMGILYNRSIIKRSKLADPLELVKRGQWTWDILLEYSQRLSKGGKIGFGTSRGATIMIESILAQKGSSLINIKTGTKPTSNLDNQTVKNSIDVIYKWLKDGKYCTTFKGQDWTYPKVEFAKGNIVMLYASHDELKREQKTTDDIGFVPFPNEKSRKTYVNTANPQFIWIMPKQHENIAAKVLFVRNELFRQQYRFVQRDFEAKWATYFSNKKDALELATNMMYSRGNHTTVYNWMTVCENQDKNVKTSTVIDSIMEGKDTISSSISKYNKLLTRYYNEMWDGYTITGKK